HAVIQSCPELVASVSVGGSLRPGQAASPCACRAGKTAAARAASAGGAGEAGGRNQTGGGVSGPEPEQGWLVGGAGPQGRCADLLRCSGNLQGLGCCGDRPVRGGAERRSRGLSRSPASAGA